MQQSILILVVIYKLRIAKLLLSLPVISLRMSAFESAHVSGKKATSVVLVVHVAPTDLSLWEYS